MGSCDVGAKGGCDVDVTDGFRKKSAEGVTSGVGAEGVSFTKAGMCVRRRRSGVIGGVGA